MVDVVAIEKEDYENLSKFFIPRENGKMAKKEFWLERFKDWWDTNPCFSNETIRGWLLKDNGRIVGFIGNIPTKFQLHGKEINAYNGVYWNVLPEYRQQSMSLFYNQLKGGPVVFMTTPSDAPLKMFKAMKIELMPRYRKNKNIQTMSFIIRNSGKLFKHYSAKKYDGSKLFRSLVKIIDFSFKIKIGSVISKIFDFFMGITQGIRLRKIKISKDIEIRELSKANEDFNELWNRTKNNYENTNIRTSNIINWYLKNKNHYFFLIGCYKKGKLIGYAIFKRYPSKLIAECVDLWVEDEEALKSFVWFAKNCSKNYPLVLFPHFNDELRKIFEKYRLFEFNFFERRDYYKLNDRTKPVTEKNSYFTGLQGDHDLW